jgi:GT2 family glycosyltransferase
MQDAPRLPGRLPELGQQSCVAGGLVGEVTRVKDPQRRVHGPSEERGTHLSAVDPAAGYNAEGPAVELVIVAYRSRHQVEQLLAGLPPDLPLVLVDNFDDGDGLADVICSRQHGRYLRGGGVGYSRAANSGARTSEADFIVFVNPDIRPTVMDIRTLVADVASDPRCSASAGVVVGPDGRPSWGMAGRDPSLLRAAIHAVGLHRVVPRLGIYSPPRLDGHFDLDWICGACMAVHRQTFLDLGCFDEDFYVYNDDMAFGRQSRERGFHQRLRTDVRIPGGTGGSGAPTLEMLRLRGSSLSRYLRKYRRTPKAQAIIVCLGAGHLARVVAHVLRGDGASARANWAQALGLLTGRATVAGRQVVGGH